MEKKDTHLKKVPQIDIPAEKLVQLLKNIKAQTWVKPELKQDIEWSIDKIANGKVYETEFELPSPATSFKYYNELLTPAMAKLTEMLPWLAHYSTPGVKIEDIEAYERDKKKVAAAALAKPQEKRKSVLVEDLAKEIEKSNELMATINTYKFNVFDFLDKFERKKLLPLVSYNILETNGCFDLIDEEKFEDFISSIRNGYKQENPFHTDIHATDVLQMCHFMLNNGIKDIVQLDKVDIAAFLISAIVHDFKHPGVSNSFLQNTKSDLALIYNDQSVLENYHISETFQLITKNSKCNIFEGLTNEQIKMMRKRIIGCILATDMARHFEIVGSLQNLISTHDISNGKNAEKIINKQTPVTEFESKQFILSACLHAADIGNPGRVITSSEELSNRVMEEFWRQGDLEKKMGLPVSNLCDREKVNVPGAQIGFISGFTIPTFEKLATIFPKFKPLLENAIISETKWKEKLKSVDSNKKPE